MKGDIVDWIEGNRVIYGELRYAQTKLHKQGFITYVMGVWTHIVKCGVCGGDQGISLSVRRNLNDHEEHIYDVCVRCWYAVEMLPVYEENTPAGAVDGIPPES